MSTNESKEILVPVVISLPEVLQLELKMTVGDIIDIDKKYKAKGTLISLAIFSLESAINELKEAKNA